MRGLLVAFKIPLTMGIKTKKERGTLYSLFVLSPMVTFQTLSSGHFARGNTAMDFN